MSENSQLRDYLNVRETAQILDVHENTIRNWVRAGTIRSSRVPGSSSHRFERREVERLQSERGAATSSVAPLLRIDSPDLVEPADLDRWARTDDARGAFPELFARLLTATPSVANVEMRSHEGASAPGWDGSASSAGSTVLPAGELCFELGTGASIKAKADSDYLKRVGDLDGLSSEHIYVFATPRNWPTGQGWAKARTSEGHFKAVRVLDAYSLSLWLQSTPSVHHWISERLGRAPRDVRTLEAWHSETFGHLRVAIPPAFFLAGRSREAETLRNRLETQEPVVTGVQAGARQESIAFLHAATVDKPQLASRMIVVKNATAWHRIADSREPLVLIPDFSDVDTRAAIENGHSVVLAAGSSERIPAPEVALPKVDPHLASESLRLANGDRIDEYRLVALARRSFSALLRAQSSDARVRYPDWTRDSEIAATLARLALVGVWTAHPDDRALVSALVDASENEIDRALSHLELQEDAPFVRSGGLWRVTSPYEIGLLLFPRLGDTDQATWLRTIDRVFFEPDPLAGMDGTERLIAQSNGIGRRYSDAIRVGLAEQLALMAGLSGVSYPGLPTDNWPNVAVERVLAVAADDETGRSWSDLAPVLPLLAEASPHAFLDAVEQDLDAPEPVLPSLFQDTRRDFFGSSSPHTGLLWALEGLCWDPEFFVRATAALACLAAIDPGGKLSNRPFGSLESVTHGWIRHSSANAGAKLALIRRLLQRMPKIGWQLLLAVWPSDHQTAFAPHTPLYRDWTPTDKRVSWEEWGEFVDGIAGLAMEYVAQDPYRWVDVIDMTPAMPPRHRERLLAALGDQHRDEWDADVHFAIWKQLVDVTSKHDQFPDADWSMSEDELRAWHVVADDIGPAGDVRRFALHFAWRARLAALRADADGVAALDAQRSSAVDEIVKHGPDVLQAFTKSVDDPWSVGIAIAARGNDWDREVLSWLGDDDESLRQAAMAIAHERATVGGIDWVIEALAWPEMTSDNHQQRLVRAIPADSTNWSRLPALGADLEKVYWQNLNAYTVGTVDRSPAIRVLLEMGLPWSAITILSNQVQDEERPDCMVVKKALRDAAANASPVPDRTMASHHVEKLLEYLEAVDLADPDLIQLEFTYFTFLYDRRHTNALYRALGQDPTEFVAVVSAAFRAEGEPSREQTEAESARARTAWDVLRHWPTIPGQDPDGKIDSTHLRSWVAAARAALARSGRTSIGDEIIGEVLSASPTDSDGIWPVLAVRDVIETLKNARIDTGLHIGTRNRRGITTRGAFDGGEQERLLEERYRSMATAASIEWPRTARILRSLADSYQAEARSHDAEAERRGDHG